LISGRLVSKGAVVGHFLSDIEPPFVFEAELCSGDCAGSDPVLISLSILGYRIVDITSRPTMFF